MVRTERAEARERKKEETIEAQSWDEDALAAVDEQYANEAPRWSEPRWWEDVEEGDEVGPLVKGPLTVTDMVCWHVGMGMGLYGVAPLRLGWRNRQRIPRFYHRDDLGIPDVLQRVHWDPAYARDARATRRRSTTAACARRGSSTSAPTGWATTRGSGSSTASSGSSTTWVTRSGCAAPSRASTWPTATALPSTSTSGREPAGRADDAGARDDPAAEPRARRRAPARPAGRDRRPPGRARRHRRALRPGRGPMTYEPSDGLGVELRDGVLRLTLDRPEKRNALDDSMTAELIHHFAAAQEDESVRVIVLTGAGDDFCSGFDLVGRNAGAMPRSRAVGSIQRRLPLQAHALLPMMLIAQVPVVARRPRLGRRDRAPPRARGRLLRGRAVGPALGAVRGARASPPTAAARGCSPGSSAWRGAKELLMLGRELSGEEAADVGADPRRGRRRRRRRRRGGARDPARLGADRRASG